MTKTEEALIAWDAACKVTDTARTAHYAAPHENEVERKVTFDIYKTAVDVERDAYQNFLKVERAEKHNTTETNEGQ